MNNTLSIQSLRLIDLYKLKDLNLNCDEAVQSILNQMITIRNEKVIYDYLLLIRKSDII